jgi:hypothetical protein
MIDIPTNIKIQISQNICQRSWNIDSGKKIIKESIILIDEIGFDNF